MVQGLKSPPVIGYPKKLGFNTTWPVEHAVGAVVGLGTQLQALETRDGPQAIGM